ncbi:MAG: iron-containing alcohol dehydrogenase [Syntrophales bacterium]|nr:iron-containing alcohol dehydrogenase [Syntrophales bacterium]
MGKVFSFTGAKKIVFGCGSLEQLPELLFELKVFRPYIVMDPSLCSLGMEDRFDRLLGTGGFKYHLFQQVEAEPPLESADLCAKAARRHKADGVIGIGGGSAMDLAKAVSVLAPHGVKGEAYLGLNKIPQPGLPKIMIPTTAGTGSEVTFTAVFRRKSLQKKEGMNSPYLYPELALLDPELTLSLPPEVTATTGIDALCHAVESYTSLQASPMSEIFSRKAIALIGENLRTCVHNGKDLEARSAMLLASLYAGLGLANAGVTAVHSLSYPLGGKFGIPHGLANTILLPHVMAFNLPAALEKFADVAALLGEVTDDISVREAAEMAVESVYHLIEDCGINSSLEDLGVKEDDFPELAEAAMTVVRPLQNNPRKVKLEDAVNIYRAAY